ncbi:hypothetical protein [Streptacidiphilus sp. PAMC 29251]
MVPPGTDTLPSNQRAVRANACHHSGRGDSRWLPDTGLGQRTLHALAQAYATHPHWQEQRLR